MTTTDHPGRQRSLAANDLAALYAAHRLALVRLAILLVDDQASAEDAVSDRAPFGWGYTEGFGGHLTWTSGDGAHLLTREQVGTEGEEWDVWEWTRNGDLLIANTRGPACFDLETDTVTPC